LIDKKCEVARNIIIDGVKYKVADPEDSCYAVNKVLAKHEGSKLITPKEYEAVLKAKAT